MSGLISSTARRRESAAVDSFDELLQFGAGKLTGDDRLIPEPAAHNRGCYHFSIDDDGNRLVELLLAEERKLLLPLLGERQLDAGTDEAGSGYVLADKAGLVGDVNLVCRTAHRRLRVALGRLSLGPADLH